jgi:CubicO group peptidase (beta-lactamase class C family)
MLKKKAMEKYWLKGWMSILLVCFILACDDSGEEAEDEPGRREKGGVYFPPLSGSDWETEDLAAAGWNKERLDEAISFAREKNTYALMILHHGRIVTENYWQESTRSSMHELESVTKSMMAFIIGSLQQDNVLSIDDPVSDYLGAGWSKAPEAKEKQITIRHLLTMTSGLDYELSHLQDAGTTWYYSHAAFTILFRIVEKVSGMSFTDYFDKTLFGKIGMGNFAWQGTDLLANARDLARFGLMIISDGKWNDETLMTDKGYFADMFKPSQSYQQAYGYLWWLNGQSSYYDDSSIIDGWIYPAMPADARLAMGHNDQRIEVVPSLGLVVIRQGGPTGLHELGAGSFDNEFWKLMMEAVPDQNDAQAGT